MSAGNPLMPYSGFPGTLPQSPLTAGVYQLTLGDDEYFPQGMVLDGANADDPGNTPYPFELRPGCVLGKIGNSASFGSSIIDQLQSAYTVGGTSLALTPAGAAALQRRNAANGGSGSVGDLIVTGPATAGDTVNSQRMTFTGINVQTGSVTVEPTEGGTADVQTLTLGTVNAASGFTLSYNDQTTAAITATTGLAAAIQAALRLLGGDLTGVVVALATGSDNVTASTYSITFATAGYANLVGVTTLTGGATFTVAHTTPGIAPGAAGVAEVQTYTWTVSPTGGTMTVSANGASALIAYSGTNGTFSANIQAGLRSLGGGFVGCSVSGTVATAFVVTFATAGPQQVVGINIASLTSATGYTAVRTTPGVAATEFAFVAGSLVGPADGSATPVALLGVGNQSTVCVTNWMNVNRVSVPQAPVLCGGTIIEGSIVNYPADTALQVWLKAALRVGSPNLKWQSTLQP